MKTNSETDKKNYQNNLFQGAWGLNSLDNPADKGASPEAKITNQDS